MNLGKKSKESSSNDVAQNLDLGKSGWTYDTFKKRHNLTQEHRHIKE
jgi:hypothetical protein